MIVSNSSPLIYLAKLSLFDHLKKVYPQISIPVEVYAEVVVQGKKEGFWEVAVIEQLIEQGYIIVEKVSGERSGPLTAPQGLHLGEARAIQLCLQKKAKHILLDDKEAIEYAGLVGLQAVRTTRILLELVKRRQLSKGQFKQALVQLSKEGYFLTIEVYEYLLEEVEKYHRE